MENLLQRVTKNEQRLDEHDRRLENVEVVQNQLVELNRQNAVMIENIKTMQCDVGNIKKTVNELDLKFIEHELEPADKWNKAVWIILSLIISLVVGGVLGLVLKGIGLGG